MAQTEFSIQLLEAAAHDLCVWKKLVDDADVHDSMLGFHAQQTAEKCLKAVLQGQDPRITLRCIAGYLRCGPGTGRLRLNQGQQAGLIEQSDAELAGFVELGAGFGAGDDEVGLLGDRAADFAAGGFDQVFGSIAR